MSGIEGIGGRVHLRPEDDETTKAIVERDAKVAISGNDKTWRQTKTEQQSHVGVVDAFHAGHAAFEGAEISGAVHGGKLGAIGGADATRSSSRSSRTALTSLSSARSTCPGATKRSGSRRTSPTSHASMVTPSE